MATVGVQVLLVNLPDQALSHALHAVCDKGELLWQLGGLRVLCVGRSALEGVVALDGKSGQLPPCVVDLFFPDDDPALTGLVGSACSAESVNVLLATGGNTELDNVGDVGEIHASGSYIGGNEDARLGLPEVISSPCTISLVQTRVNGVRRRQGVHVAGQVLEKLVEHLDLGRLVEEDNSLHGVGAMLAILRLLDDLQQGRHEVLETGYGYNVLGHLLVGRCLVGVDSLDELEVACIDVDSGDLDDILGDSGREQEGLSWLLPAVGQEAHNLLQFLVESDVKHSVGLVEHQSLDIWCVDSAVFVAEKIEETTGCSDQEMAALGPCLAQHHGLVHSTDGGLDLDTGVAAQFAGFGTDLLCQFSRRGDDDGSDVVCSGLLGGAGCERGVLLDDSGDGGNEESKGLASTGPSLSDTVQLKVSLGGIASTSAYQWGDVHVLALQGRVDAHGLNVCHGLILHVLEDCLEDVVVDADGCEISKACDDTRLASSTSALSCGSRVRVAS